MTMSSPIPQASPLASYLAHREEIDAAIGRVLCRGHYILGEEVSTLEREFAAYIGVRFGIGVGSGTEALHLALRACGIGPGDEVVTVSYTAVGTVAAIELCGAVPLFADIDPATFTLDPSQIESAITPRTKAIIPVHLYGHPADMEALLSVAKQHGVRIIEDCAQSHGAEFGGKKAGAWGDIAAFSFYPTKNMGAVGDGGMVVTNHEDLAERAGLLREYGWRQRYISEVPGWNTRLDELQAAVLRVKLRHLEQDNARRRELAAMYSGLLSGTCLQLPQPSSAAMHVYHQYVVRTPRREALREYLYSVGIGTLIHYPRPVHLQPAYVSRLEGTIRLPETERASLEVLSLPIFPELGTREVQAVAESIMKWDKRDRNT